MIPPSVEAISKAPTPASAREDGEVLVRVENVSKKFCRNLKKSLWYGACDIAAELNPARRRVLASGRPEAVELRSGEFWANQNISFELRRGECLGLIGRNGAGKTTLLKLLNGLIKPDAGRIEMRGRVAALIALGAGFNPILTGRENIYVNGSVLGLTKREIDAKVENIIDFADVRDFIDAPVQSYSSGMQVRLGFAVATALDPDILILDEILAVGDRDFQIKCLTRVGEQLKTAAVIFVGHQMERVAQICTRTIVLNKGQTTFAGDVNGGIEEYNRQSDSPVDHSVVLAQGFTLRGSRPPALKLGYGAPLMVELDFECDAPSRALVRIVFVNTRNEILAEWNSQVRGVTFEVTAGRNRLVCEVPQVLLRPDRYRCNVLLQPVGSSAYLIAANSYVELDVQHPSYGCYPVQF